ncbi:hypothetical protein CYY_003956 [Polysphondylium violaceum]|uniref:Methylosome subunit pICln n=1 Tax=Polysphondylium violaceum TaxID=133409 RepID=A0A8J4PYX5_9MYCE|nr:hypothetical protein CYY_003956 [Polysphondylium violaceum]
MIENYLGLEEEVFYRLSTVTVYIKSTNIGAGDLFISNKNVHWIEKDTNKHYSFNFYQIGLNAIFNRNEEYPMCVYIQVDGDVSVPDSSNGNSMDQDSDNDDDNNNNNDEQYTEVRFIPQQEEQVKDLYDAFCKGALLNPDEEEEDEGEFYYGQEDYDEQQQDDRFNDAYEDEE